MIKKVKFLDSCIISGISLLLLMILYSYLYSHIGYMNLEDFYVGESIYKNHNKYLDIACFFAYCALFFCIMPIYCKLKELFKFSVKFNLPEINVNNRVVHILLFVLFFVILFAPMSVISDNYHSGETIATYFLAKNFNMEFYKDIMLVHGFSDLSIPFISDIFNVDFIIANKIYCILLKTIIFILSYIIFGASIFTLLPLINPSLITVFVLTYFVLLKDKVVQTPFMWLILWILIANIFSMYWTTMGTFWILASLPMVICMIYNLFKFDKKYVKILLLVLLVIILVLLQKDFILNYLEKAQYYIKGNLFAFGNDFPAHLKFREWFSTPIKLFALLIIPYFIIEWFKELNNENKNRKYMATLTFAILFPLFALNYMLGRIDGIMFNRVRDISMCYLSVVLPLIFIYKKSSGLKFLKYISIVVLIGFYGLLFIKPIHKILPVEVNIDKSVIGETFFDLSNNGMNYKYFHKKMFIPYVSYYNSISTKQAKDSVEQLKEIFPKMIYIYGKQACVRDEVRPSLRVNPIYRWIILSERYNLLKIDDEILLSLTDKYIFSKSDLKILDKILSTEDLQYLPDAWGASLKTLPMEKVEIKYTQDKNTINFNQAINGTSFDLIYFEIKPKNNMQISINNSNSKIKFASKTGKVIVPFDNFPSWLKSENIKQLTVENAEDIKNVTFYKKK